MEQQWQHQLMVYHLNHIWQLSGSVMFVDTVAVAGVVVGTVVAGTAIPVVDAAGSEQ